MGNVRRGGTYPLVRGRRARAAGADHRADGLVAQDTDGRARLHGGGQRSGALRGRAAHPRAGAHHPRAGARPGLQASRAAPVPRRITACRFRPSAPPTRSIAACGGSPSAGKRRSPPRAASRKAPGCCPRTPSVSPRAPERHIVGFVAGVPASLDGERADAGRPHREAGAARGPLRHRPRHSSGRHRHRHQGTGRLRGAGGGGAAHGASRAREAGAHRQAGAHQGIRRAALRRPRARGTASRSRVPRHRGPARVLAGARDRRGERAAASRRGVHRGRQLAAFPDGRLERGLRRGRRRMDAGGCARLLQDAGAHGHLLPACRRCRDRRALHQQPSHDERHAHGGRGQDRLGHAGPRAHARDPHRPARFPARRAW